MLTMNEKEKQRNSFYREHWQSDYHEISESVNPSIRRSQLKTMIRRNIMLTMNEKEKQRNSFYREHWQSDYHEISESVNPSNNGCI